MSLWHHYVSLWRHFGSLWRHFGSLWCHFGGKGGQPGGAKGAPATNRKSVASARGVQGWCRDGARRVQGGCKEGAGRAQGGCREGHFVHLGCSLEIFSVYEGYFESTLLRFVKLLIFPTEFNAFTYFPDRFSCFYTTMGLTWVHFGVTLG